MKTSFTHRLQFRILAPITLLVLAVIAVATDRKSVV